MGRERVTDRERRRSPCGSRPTTPRATSPARREFEPGPGPSRLPTFKRQPPFLRPGSSEPTVTRKTNELARMMNADIVQADPIGEGPINNIVIPPGIVSDNRTTIISIQQPSADIEANSQLANRSIQVISDTLDEQDAVETSAVQGRLTELQQARRDFVMAVANVGANAVNIEEESPPPSLLSPGISETPQRHLLKVPDLEDEFLQPEYTREHPDVVAAREFMEQRDAARRIEDEFERIAAQEQMADDLQLDVPFEEELYQERDISWEEDESGMAIPRPSRVKAYIPSVPTQARPYQYEPFNPENLERFFDLQRHPPCPQYGPPVGREQLNPDLWELEDPWYRPPPEPEGPDLMEFDLMDFD
nr:uncharacterized protein LOC117610348 isoform X2 [Osmia lignaria]